MLALLVAVGVVAGASIAIAAPSGSSSGSKSSSESRSTTERLRVRGPGPRADLNALAKKLGVSASELRNALEAVRDERKPPSRPAEPPSRQDLEERCTEFTDALAKELGKSGDEVRSAMKEVAKDRIDAAEKAGRLEADEADRLRERIDSSGCVPFGIVHRGGPGCGGPGGFRHGPGGPPPADRNRNGSDDSGTAGPAAGPSVVAI
jgi:hypothetical protein